MPAVVQDNAFNYDKGVLAEILEPIMGKGLIPADLETWKPRRRAIVPSFHKAYLEAMVQMFGRCTQNSLDKFDALLEGQGVSRLVSCAASGLGSWPLALGQECRGRGCAVHVSGSRAGPCTCFSRSRPESRKRVCWLAPLIAPELAVAGLLGLCLGWLCGLLLGL